MNKKNTRARIIEMLVKQHKDHYGCVIAREDIQDILNLIDQEKRELVEEIKIGLDSRVEQFGTILGDLPVLIKAVACYRIDGFLSDLTTNKPLESKPLAYEKHFRILIGKDRCDICNHAMSDGAIWCEHCQKIVHPHSKKEKNNG